jgi:hypothetical protein
MAIADRPVIPTGPLIPSSASINSYFGRAEVVRCVFLEFLRAGVYPEYSVSQDDWAEGRLRFDAFDVEGIATWKSP